MRGVLSPTTSCWPLGRRLFVERIDVYQPIGLFTTLFGGSFRQLPMTNLGLDVRVNEASRFQSKCKDRRTSPLAAFPSQCLRIITF